MNRPSITSRVVTDVSTRLRPFGSACVVVLLAVVLTACTTGPNYHRPAMATPPVFQSATSDEKAPPDLSRDWWKLYDDSELTTLVDEALAANLDVQVAMARVAQARESARSVKSAYYPVVSMNPTVTRSRTPGAEVSTSGSGLSEATSALTEVSGLLSRLNNLNQGTTGTTGGTDSGTSGLSDGTASSAGSGATLSTRVQVPFDLSYEIDIWGRTRRSYESARAQAQASVFDLEVVRQTMLADLVRDYFNLRSLDAQQEILSRYIGLYQEQVDLTGMQAEAGLRDETDVLQATVQLENTRAQAADTTRQRADLEHAIAILVGRAPADFSLPIRALDATPPTIPAGFPADLLERRPDVAEAEQQLMAASADIGVAEADLLPSIKLTGSVGYQGSDIANITGWSRLGWSFGPSISLPIFNGGKLRAEVRKAKARYDELDAAYRKTVLTAMGDVEDALTDLHLRDDASASQTKAVAAAREYLRLTQIEYESGLVDYLQVVDAEQSLLNSELSEVQLLNQRMASTVLLIKAIGGGWLARADALDSGAPVRVAQAEAADQSRWEIDHAEPAK